MFDSWYWFIFPAALCFYAKCSGIKNDLCYICFLFQTQFPCFGGADTTWGGRLLHWGSLVMSSHALPLLVHSSHAGYLTVPQTCQTHSCLRTFASAVSFFWNLFLQIDTICLFLKNSNCIFCKAFPGHPSYFTPAWPNPFIILLIFIIALSLFEFCVGMNLFTHVKSSSFRGTVVSK